MIKKLTIITGATSGIGYETAKELFLKDYHLVLGNRNMDKAKKVKEEFLELNPRGNIDLYEIDLSSFSSIDNFVSNINQNYKNIDILINNAGVFSRKQTFTKEGFEMALGVNYLGTYYLTEKLLPILSKKDSSKIIMVSSIGCYLGKISLNEDYFFETKSSFKNYFNSKLANLIYTKHLKNNFPNLIVKAADPGIAYSHIWKWKTKLGKALDSLYRLLFKSSKQAARIIVKLATTDIYNNTNQLIYKYDKPIKMPKELNDSSKNQQFIDLTNKVIKNKQNI